MMNEYEHPYLQVGALKEKVLFESMPYSKWHSWSRITNEAQFGQFRAVTVAFWRDGVD